MEHISLYAESKPRLSFRGYLTKVGILTLYLIFILTLNEYCTQHILFEQPQKSIDALTQIFFAQIASNEPFENEAFFPRLSI
jgi:hypothetical protein